MTKTFYKESELIFKEKPTHWRFEDLTGQKFGRVTVLGFAGIDDKSITFWYCRCDCGNITKVRAGGLKIGDSISCGCFNKQRLKEANTTHGHARNYNQSTTFSIWCSMLARCNNKKSNAYKDYGGRGITVCKRWESFENFLEDMGERPSKEYTLDRKENNNGYYKENCRWADWVVQANNRRNNRYFTLNGKTQTMSQWADELGLKRTTVFNRLKRGWPIEKALTTPIKILNKRK